MAQAKLKAIQDASLAVRRWAWEKKPSKTLLRICSSQAEICVIPLTRQFFVQDVLDIKDLRIGQKLEGVVRNVVDFGAFVDIGIHEDGFIHISKLSNNFVKHPSQVVSVGDLVTVWVDKLDVEREKVNLSLVSPHESN